MMVQIYKLCLQDILDWFTNEDARARDFSPGKPQKDWEETVNMFS